MAGRQTSRAGRRAAKPPAAAQGAPLPSAAAPPGGEQADRVRLLEAERDRLVHELDAARERIAELEQARDEALNRIAWVIDSLHSLTRE